MLQWIRIWSFFSFLILLSGCSTFRYSIYDQLDDRSIKPVIQEDPVARLTVKQQQVYVGQVVSLDASISVSNRQRPLSYRWYLLEKPTSSSLSLSSEESSISFSIDHPGRYRIRLVVNDGEFDSYPFDALLSTNPDDLDQVRFITMGDFGTGSEEQHLVADAIFNVCERFSCDFVVGLGDNLYKRGPSKVHDPLFYTHFEKPYRNLNMPFFMVLGNHDTSGLKDGDGGFNARGAIEIAYQQFSKKWTMPDRYYQVSAPLKGDDFRANPTQNTQPLVDFFAMDSTPLASLPDVVPKFHLNRYIKNQSNWLQAAINNSKAQWQIAFAHHPYLSNGPHGNAGNFEGINDHKLTPRIAKLLPRLNKNLIQRIAGKEYLQFLDTNVCNRVDLFLSGHEHSLQWLKPVRRCGKTEFIVSGAGAKFSPLVDLKRNPVRWQADKRLGFFWIEIIANRMTVVPYMVDKTTGKATAANQHSFQHKGFEQEKGV